MRPKKVGRACKRFSYKSNGTLMRMQLFWVGMVCPSQFRPLIFHLQFRSMKDSENHVKGDWQRAYFTKGIKKEKEAKPEKCRLLTGEEIAIVSVQIHADAPKFCSLKKWLIVFPRLHLLLQISLSQCLRVPILFAIPSNVKCVILICRTFQIW